MHQGRSTQTVCTVVGEVTFADSKQTLNGSLQFVVYPDTTHGVVDSRINHHRVVIFYAVDFVCQFARVHIGDFFVHIEEVSVTLAHYIQSQTFDTFREVEEYSQAGIVDTETVVATFLSRTAGNVTRNQVTECRITAFQIIVAVFFRNVTAFLGTSLQSLGIFQLLRNPDTSVVTQRFRHQSQLRLLVAVYRNTSRVNLHVCRISEERAFTVASHCSRAVTCHRIGRQEVSITVTTGSDNHSMCSKTFQFTGYQILGNDTAGTAVDDYHIFHFIASVQLDCACTYLTAQCRVSTQQQLLSGLSFGIECT